MQEIRETDLVSYLPPFLMEYPQLCTTLEAEDPEFLLIWQAASRVFANKFIETADEYGISRFERLLRIYPESGASLEARRARVLALWFMPLPYTWRKLLEKLVAIYGKDDFYARQYPNEYRIRVEVFLENISEVREVIYAMLPANMLYVLVFSYETEVWNTECIQFASLQLYYKLVGWLSHRFRETLTCQWSVYEPKYMALLSFRLAGKLYTYSKVSAKNLQLHMVVMYWGSRLWNGSRRLDGSKRLDGRRRYGLLLDVAQVWKGKRIPERFLRPSMALTWEQRLPERMEANRIESRMKINFREGKPYPIRAATLLSIKVVSAGQERIGSVMVTVKTRGYRFLDGSRQLDGSRNLNSVYRKEMV